LEQKIIEIVYLGTLLLFMLIHLLNIFFQHLAHLKPKIYKQSISKLLSNIYTDNYRLEKRTLQCPAMRNGIHRNKLANIVWRCYKYCSI